MGLVWELLAQPGYCQLSALNLYDALNTLCCYFFLSNFTAVALEIKLMKAQPQCCRPPIISLKPGSQTDSVLHAEHLKTAASPLLVPTIMGTRALETLVVRINKIAEDLRTTTSPKVAMERLEALITTFDEFSTDNGPSVFLLAGGAPAIIRLLRGTATLDATSDADLDGISSAISGQAAEVLSELLLTASPQTAELVATTSQIPPLLHALRDAPNDVGRAAAGRTLLMLADARPASCRAMAEAGAVGAVVAAYVGTLPVAWEMGFAEAALELGRRLVRSEPAAARDLVSAIHASESIPVFGALLFLQVWSPRS